MGRRGEASSSIRSKRPADPRHLEWTCLEKYGALMAEQTS
jgi:hypothetical protein